MKRLLQYLLDILAILFGVAVGIGLRSVSDCFVACFAFSNGTWKYCNQLAG